MLAHAFLAVTARASRPGTLPPELAPAGGDDSSQAAKKGDLTPVEKSSPRQGRTPRQRS